MPLKNMYKFLRILLNCAKITKKVLKFPVLRSKENTLRRFSKKVRRRATSHPQLLEALHETSREYERSNLYVCPRPQHINKISGFHPFCGFSIFLSIILAS